MVGGALAILLVLVLVWVARQDQNELELSPAGAVHESRGTLGQDSEVLPSLHLAWERGKGSGASSEAQNELWVEVQEGGYLLVAQKTPSGLAQRHPNQGRESASIDSGSHRLNLERQSAGAGTLVGVYCPFPFSFDDLKTTPRGAAVPARCTVSVLSELRQAP
jgi:hypothetical protein